MTDIKQANEIIAFFDGRKKTMIDGEWWWSDVEQMDLFVWKEHELQYHSDYNWFMGVWKKYCDLKLIENYAIGYRQFEMDFISRLICFKPLEDACLRFAQGLQDISWHPEFNIPKETCYGTTK